VVGETTLWPQAGKTQAGRVAEGGTGLCVPEMSSTSCDLRVFMEDAAEAVTALDPESVWSAGLGSSLTGLA